MRFVIVVACTLLVAGLLQSILPWWVVAIAGLAGGFMLKSTPWRAFMAGFIAIWLLWATYAFLLDSGNEQILSTRIGALFGSLSRWSLIILTGLIGGIVGGLGAVTGALIQKHINERKTA